MAQAMNRLFLNVITILLFVVRMTKYNWRREKAQAQKRNTGGKFIKEDDWGGERTLGYSISTSPKRKGEPSQNCINFFERMIKLRRLNRDKR